jgi:hypothetical protein
MFGFRAGCNKIRFYDSTITRPHESLYTCPYSELGSNLRHCSGQNDGREKLSVLGRAHTGRLS